jgi:hypothetical protein
MTATLKVMAPEGLWCPIAVSWVSTHWKLHSAGRSTRRLPQPTRDRFRPVARLALALDLRESLLWKGNDFGHTGVQSALE